MGQNEVEKFPGAAAMLESLMNLSINGPPLDSIPSGCRTDQSLRLSVEQEEEEAEAEEGHEVQVETLPDTAIDSSDSDSDSDSNSEATQLHLMEKSISLKDSESEETHETDIAPSTSFRDPAAVSSDSLEIYS